MTAYGINDSGLIVGTYRTGGGARDGFLYFPNNGGTYVTLDHPLAVNGTAVGTDVYGINNSGQLVGTYYDANLKPHGFALFDFLAGYTAIDDPLGTEGTFATGINDAGQIVGYCQNNSGTPGFLYNGGTYTTLDNPSGVGATFIYGINNNGAVVGTY
jgi:probable HAF family extracellular repeat protein